ncbi:MAG TPA: hypothetical protein VMV16_09055 [Solirubrobacteraceae bacterium]|nr:hypothetical protein [Solirubrobacteraceae bacterium]
MAADHRFSGVAVKLLGGAIEHRHEPVHIGGQHRILQLREQISP